MITEQMKVAVLRHHQGRPAKGTGWYSAEVQQSCCCKACMGGGRPTPTSFVPSSDTTRFCRFARPLRLVYPTTNRPTSRLGLSRRLLPDFPLRESVRDSLPPAVHPTLGQGHLGLHGGKRGKNASWRNEKCGGDVSYVDRLENPLCCSSGAGGWVAIHTHRPVSLLFRVLSRPLFTGKAQEYEGRRSRHARVPETKSTVDAGRCSIR